MSHPRTTLWSEIRGQVSVLVILVLLLLLTTSLGSSRVAFESSELAFTDPSPSGIQIVPASCPSYPHYTDECSTQDPGALNCSIQLQPWSVAAGGSASLSWVGPSGAVVSYVSGAISPGIGSVGQSGSQSVAPANTTTYTYTGTQRILGIFTRSFSCDATLIVTGDTAGNCPDNQHQSGGNCVCNSTNQAPVNGQCTITSTSCPAGQYRNTNNVCICAATGIAPVGGSCLTSSSLCPASTFFCGTGATANNLYYRTYSSAPACTAQTSLYARCFYGCNAGAAACNSASTNPSVEISAKPSLVRTKDTVNIEWHTTDAATCSVVGSNGDGPWTELTTSKVSKPIEARTTFTITCSMRDGSSLTDSATVNILPVFNEQ